MLCSIIWITIKTSNTRDLQFQMYRATGSISKRVCPLIATNSAQITDNSIALASKLDTSVVNTLATTAFLIRPAM